MRLPTRCAGALAAAALLLTGCDDTRTDQGHQEVLPAMEVKHKDAVLRSVAEVPGGELVALTMSHRRDGPVWRGEVAASNGVIHLVRLDTTLGRLLGPATVPSRSAERAREIRTLLEEARLTAEEAVAKVHKPYFGKVTAVELVEHRGKASWKVDVVTISESHIRIYHVDAVTGEVLDQRTVGKPVAA